MDSEERGLTGEPEALMTGGIEWLIDAFGCDPRRLRDPKLMLELSETLTRVLELSVLGTPQLHQFGGPGGITALYLLSESHLAWHTYPEAGLATLNLYCCRARPEPDWKALLENALAAREIAVTRIERGQGAAARARYTTQPAPATPGSSAR